MEIRGMNVVVTGGSRGLGLGLVEALVAHGAKVTVVARDADALESVRAQLGVATISADVTDEAAAHRMLDDSARHLGAQRGYEAADGAAGPAELGRLRRDVGDRRQGRVPLAAGRAQAAARAWQPRPGGIQRRGPERLAALGRLRRRQTHALADGQVRQRRLGAEEPRDPLSGDRAAADGRRHGRRRRGRHGVRTRDGYPPGAVPCPLRRAHATEAVRRQRCRRAGDPQYAGGLAFGLKGDTGISVFEGATA